MKRFHYCDHSGDGENLRVQQVTSFRNLAVTSLRYGSVLNRGKPLRKWKDSALVQRIQYSAHFRHHAAARVWSQTVGARVLAGSVCCARQLRVSGEIVG
jgi:hypothetical protein